MSGSQSPAGLKPIVWLVLSALVLAAMLASCSSGSDRKDRAATATTTSLGEVDPAQLDPYRGVPATVDRSGGRGVDVPVEAVKDLGEGRYAVSVFLPPCGRLVSLKPGPEPGTFVAQAADLNCSAERVLVTVTVP